MGILLYTGIVQGLLHACDGRNKPRAAFTERRKSHRYSGYWVNKIKQAAACVLSAKSNLR